MNWDDFETLVRSSCDDELQTVGDDSDATWTTEDIIGYTNLALANYSRHFPCEQVGNIVVVEGTKSYSLPADIITPVHKSIADARWQRSSTAAVHLSISRWKPGVTEGISSIGTGIGASLWGTNLILEDAPSAEDALYPIELYYLGVHDSVPADPTEFDFSVPEADMECVFWYTTALMMMKLDAGDASLRQYADKRDLGSSRDDSPPRRSAQYRMKMYESCISTRLAGQSSPRLRRVGR